MAKLISNHVVPFLQMRPLGFSVLQGEIGFGAAGPRGPQGLPGPQVGPPIHAPGLVSCSLPSFGDSFIPSLPLPILEDA